VVDTKNDNPQNCNVALVGFGTVGSSVARILCERLNTHLRITHILNRNVARKKVDWLPPSVQWTETIDDVLSSDVDIVVEVMGGLQPAENWIRRAQAIDRTLRLRIDRHRPPDETADPVWSLGRGRRAGDFRIA
jgi:lactate dehydrogenase-like 2-hydroxyacid dehydrogenase